MATERARRRSYEQLEQLSAGLVDPFALRFQIVELLRPVVGFDRWCWPTCDPDSGLGTTAVGEHDYWPVLQRLLLLDQRLDEPSALPALDRPIARNGGTGGLRFLDVLGPIGIGDELRVPLADRHGLWGCLDLMRSTDDRPFSEADIAFLDTLTPLAAATRRSAAAAAAGTQISAPPAAGVLVLDSDLDVRAATASARAWLAELVPPDFEFAHIAALGAVYNVASRAFARAAADHSTGRHGNDLAPRVRVRSISGAWAIIEADLLDPYAGTVAVTIRPASAHDVLDLRLVAHDLTAREREIVTVLLDGSETHAVAERLFLSPHTVNDHVKAIFAKIGVRTRKQLLATLATPAVMPREP
jgi:DNA-binding CsgD family transcriptional regulator